MGALKNEVLEKSNTRFPAPPIKNDLIIRLSYTHRFYEITFSKTVLDTYTVLFGGSGHLRRLVWWF